MQVYLDLSLGRIMNCRRGGGSTPSTHVIWLSAKQTIQIRSCPCQCVNYLLASGHCVWGTKEQPIDAAFPRGINDCQMPLHCLQGRCRTSPPLHPYFRMVLVYLGHSLRHKCDTVQLILATFTVSSNALCQSQVMACTASGRLLFQVAPSIMEKNNATSMEG